MLDRQALLGGPALAACRLHRDDEAERRDAIRAQREARRRELDAPARLAFKRRQLAHSQQAGDAARVAELRREIAALEP